VQAFNNLLSQHLASARSGTRDLAMANSSTGYLADQPGGALLASMELDSIALGYAIAAMFEETQTSEENEEAEQQSPSDAYVPLMPDRTSEWSAHAKTYGIFSNQDSNSNRTGYTSDSYGVQVGLDRMFGENWIVGIALGYTNTDADLDGGVGDLDVDEYRIGPYATYKGDGGRWFIDLSATYGHHDTDSDRTTVGGTATADYDAHDVTLYAGAGTTSASARTCASPPQRRCNTSTSTATTTPRPVRGR